MYRGLFNSVKRTIPRISKTRVGGFKKWKHIN